MVPDVRFDTYYRYADLTRILQAFASEYPHLVRLESIGKSYQGRDIWLARVTRFAAGSDEQKPALWVDGNIHASEVSPSTACLYLLHYLVSNDGADPDVTRCLDTRAFYICPRVNPDGAEWALADKPKIVRSSTRPYPHDEEPIDGLVMEDIDGDGRILLMRIPDANGPWKACPEEPRLMVRREPAETGGSYYRLLREGRLEAYDGVTIRVQKNKEGLDLNRNFPVNWRQEHEQEGAGPYPTSEPEIRAMVQFIVSHPNITGGIAYHTMSGALLRPYGDRPDEAMPAEDLWTFEKIGQKGSQITGYPAVSVYHHFRYHPQKVITGVFDDWLYDHLGLFAWTVEIWSPQQQAGIEKYDFIDWRREHPLEDNLKLLRWSDEVLAGQGYIDWYPFEHPQLGPLELGGWDYLYALKNPPPHLLEKEIAPFAGWMVWHLLISPRLELFEASAKPLGENTYLLRLVVHNTGWLPTYVTRQALQNKLVRGLVCQIDLPQGASLETGQIREELGQLEGRAYKPCVPAMYDPTDATEDRLKVEWVVRAPAGGTVTLTARHDRAGTVVATVDL
ncbi:MAG: M14 family metallopeptidase [Chloroflexota bacterium]